MSKSTSTHYEIRFYGKIWLPKARASATRRYTEDDNKRISDPFDLSDPKKELEFLEYKLLTDSGDFSTIEAWEATKVETETVATVVAKGESLSTTVVHRKNIRSFSEEEETNFCEIGHDIE